MKTRILILSGLLFTFSFFGYAQKEIKDVPLSEGSKLTISAKAETVNNVSFTIKPTTNIDGKDLDGIKLPYEMKVAPFNQKTFKDSFLQFLERIEIYQSRNFTLYEFLKELKNTSEAKHDRKDEVLEAISKSFSDELKTKFFGKKSVTLEEIKEKLKNENLEPQKADFIEAIEGILKKRITDFLDDDLKKALKASRKPGDNNVTDLYAMRVRLEDRISTIYRYFNDQIVLLFEYDTEPVAGTLYFNKKIEGVQYFTSRSYETYFQNRVGNYHKLIKRLYSIWISHESKKNERGIKCCLDSVNPLYKSSEGNLTDDILESMTNIEYRKDSIAKTINEKVEELRKNLETIEWYEAKDFINKIKGYPENEKYSKGISLSLSEAEEYHVMKERDNYFSKNKTEAKKYLQKIRDTLLNRQTKRMVEALRKDDLKQCYYFQIQNFFKHNRKEYKSIYIDNPKQFYDRFIAITHKFRIYNRHKRKEFVYEELLKHKNKEVFNDLAKIKPNYEQKVDSLKRLRVGMDYLNTKELFFEALDKYTKSFKNELESEDVNYYINKERIELRKEIISELENLAAKDEEITFSKVYDRNATLEFIKQNSDSLIKTKVERYENLIDTKMDGSEDKVQGEFRKKVEEYQNELLTMIRKDKWLIDSDIYDKTLYDNLVLMDVTDLRAEYSKISKSQRRYFERERNAIEKTEKEIKEDISKLEADIQKQIKKAPLWNLETELLELDFNEGFTEHIVMYGTVKEVAPVDEESRDLNENWLKDILKNNNDWESNIGRKLKFVNQFPYGFSSSKDYDDFKEYKLVVYRGKHREFEVSLEKIFPNYVQKLGNNRLDFSPKNNVVTLRQEHMAEDKNNSIELRKETSSQLFDFSLYTDFVGFQDNPNGLVQVEFSKLVPLYTKRKTDHFWQRYLGQGYNFGRFNYIIPQFRWARLDSGDDSDNLPLSYATAFEGGTESRLPFVTTVSLLRYENISVGADLNLVSFDFPNSKFRFELNAGGRYGRTKVLDTRGEPIQITSDSTNVRATLDVNTWRYYPEFIFRLRPEERYGANLSLRPIRFNTVTDDFSTVSSEEKFRQDLTDNPQWLHQIEINAHFSPSGRKDNRFFFRYRYTTNADWETNGFGEIQLGYTMSFRVANKRE
ncbi:hypothetical protein [Flagellimonas nanhaiensis]|uniref:Uncharacterized protein n=1 Tax=Flagellimonas nanhaiensis TaxID=2292706 RepID=A0A371JR84_9FLAO|nr:hypothetical protein [Allomuricauda nanhaiensis]RDY60020.1 hypothetical protein DX873_11790 [Allomuricauda nanhaiensis]